MDVYREIYTKEQSVLIKEIYIYEIKWLYQSEQKFRSHQCLSQAYMPMGKDTNQKMEIKRYVIKKKKKKKERKLLLTLMDTHMFA